jgi:hypothetical protein
MTIFGVAPSVRPTVIPQRAPEAGTWMDLTSANLCAIEVLVANRNGYLTRPRFHGTWLERTVQDFMQNNNDASSIFLNAAAVSSPWA